MRIFIIVIIGIALALTGTQKDKRDPNNELRPLHARIDSLKILRASLKEKIDFINFNIVKDDAFSGNFYTQIAFLVNERFGDKMKYSINFVDSIQQEESGKYRFCISKLNRDII